MSTVAPPSSITSIDAALRAAAGLTGMEVVYLTGLTDSSCTFLRVHGDMHPAITEGSSLPRADTLCARMLDGAPPMTSAASTDPAYRDSAFLRACPVESYIGVPVVSAVHGVIGTLCAVDARSIVQPEAVLVVLRSLADVIAGLTDGKPDVRVRRTSGGWRVETPAGSPDEVEDLTVGMALADLLTPDLIPPGRPPRAPAQVDEVSRLQTQVSQLEHALAARVVVEQAIGVLAERLGIAPRDAFERLRRLSRSRGQKVHDLARLVVNSVGESGTARGASSLPVELR